ncbi:MAG TPA: GNAT family N-acetyltransferase [Pseudonocardiaceae bacterium]|nr:GNAT family N-acetyltransferase [Pseudonocardiaceae bacterium]
MGAEQDFGPDDIRLMQGLAEQVGALRPDLISTDATVGELAWVWGKDNAQLGHTWRHKLWYADGAVVGWGWVYLPYRVKRSDGQVLEVKTASLGWQVHPEHRAVLDGILDWYEAEASGIERHIDIQIADDDAAARLAAHGYEIDTKAASDTGYWHQFNARELVDVPDPQLPPGFRFRTAEEITTTAAAQAHRDAWHPSTFTDQGMADVSRTWPYRPDLHVLVAAPDGTLAATAIAWLDAPNGTAEFEPVGTHQGYRRQGLNTALLYYGMRQAKAAGATTMLVACLGAPAHPGARKLYEDVGFKPFTKDVPYVRHP